MRQSVARVCSSRLSSSGVSPAGSSSSCLEVRLIPPQRVQRSPLTVARRGPAPVASAAQTYVAASLSDPQQEQRQQQQALEVLPQLPPRFLLEDEYRPLSTSHPAFGQQQRLIIPKRRTKPLLSTVHPAFGTSAANPLPCELFAGPVSISGFFLAVDPNLCFFLARRERMNPNAQLTISDTRGNFARARYRCSLQSSGGVKFEALLRFQVGWVSPKATFAKLPEVIHLGKGFDVSIPFLLHFTAVSILDESGCATGSYLYFSGTPMFGLSFGYSVIDGGKLVLNNKRVMDPPTETRRHFFGLGRDHRFHYRQAGFVAFKILAWLMCVLAAMPYFEPLQRAKAECIARLPQTVAPYLQFVVRLH